MAEAKGDIRTNLGLKHVDYGESSLKIAGQHGTFVATIEIGKRKRNVIDELLMENAVECNGEISISIAAAAGDDATKNNEQSIAKTNGKLDLVTRNAKVKRLRANLRTNLASVREQLVEMVEPRRDGAKFPDELKTMNDRCSYGIVFLCQIMGARACKDGNDQIVAGCVRFADVGIATCGGRDPVTEGNARIAAGN